VPLFFNLAYFLLTFLFGSKFFNPRTGLYAAFSHGDETAQPHDFLPAFFGRRLPFFYGAQLFYFSCLKFPKNTSPVSLWPGAVGGLAVLMKQTTGLLLIIVWIYVFLDSADKTKGVRGF